MATLTLNRLWINLIATGDSVDAYTAPDRPAVYEQAGEVRTFAGGRQRSITMEGERGTFSFVLQDVVRADITTLRSWQGLTVQVRDNRGRLFNGVYFGLSENERFNEPTLYQVAITLNVVSQDEGV